MTKKYQWIMGIMIAIALSDAAVARDRFSRGCRQGRCARNGRQGGSDCPRGPVKGQGTVASRGLLINAQGVPENIVAASEQASSLSADPRVAEELRQHLDDAGAAARQRHDTAGFSRRKSLL